MYKKVKTLLFSVALLLCCITASAIGTQPSAGDGSQANPYQIATSDNLVWFAGHVNSGNTSACAILTADITVNAGVLDSNGDLNSGTFTSWTPIGGFNGGGNDYSGEFNGNGSRGLVCGAFYGTIENCYAKQINSAGTTNAIGWTSGEGPHTATHVEVKDAAAFASGDVLKYSNSPLTPPTIDNVAYIDANGEQQTHDNVSIINNASEPVTWSAGRYVVQGADITLAKCAVCNGEVHLILADGAKLTATGDDGNQTPGIYVSGNGSSLTIYGQAAQSGQLIAQGGNHAAGIGGASGGNGSNITINGGKITATGGQNASGIGGGENGSASNIFVVANLIVRADGNNPPTTVIVNDGSDIAESLSGKRYAVIEHGPKGNLTINDFVVEIPGDNIYTGLVQEAVVSFTSGITGAGEITVTYKQGDEEVAPINVGDYDIYVSVTEGTDYYAFPETKIHRRSIWQASYTFSDFNVFLPENLEYDGTPKVATFVYDDKDGQRTGYGDITVKYNDSTQAPIEPGDYVVSIDISEGLNYIPLNHMTCDEWSFTITIDLDEYKADAIAEIEAAGQGIQNEYVNNWIAAAIHDINQPGTDTKAKVDNIKLKILDLIYAFQDGKAEGYAEGLEEGKAVGRAEAFGEMGTPCDDCSAVEVSKGTTTIKLYNPDKVEFKKE